MGFPGIFIIIKTDIHKELLGDVLHAPIGSSFRVLLPSTLRFASFPCFRPFSIFILLLLRYSFISFVPYEVCSYTGFGGDKRQGASARHQKSLNQKLFRLIVYVIL